MVDTEALEDVRLQAVALELSLHGAIRAGALDGGDFGTSLVEAASKLGDRIGALCVGGKTP